jgi:endoglucanase
MKRSLCLSLFCLSACAQTAAEALPPPPIIVDQFGYLPALDKIAVIKDPKIGFDAGRSFTPSQNYGVVNLGTGKAVFTGAPVAWRGGDTDAASGDRIWHFDFSKVKTPGTYVVRDMALGVDSYAFEISPTVYTPVLKTAFKTLYLQRAGFEKRAPFVSTAFADKASHLGKGQDTEARLFSDMDNPETARDLRGGWYDAGDYNKYTSWTANYVTWLLAAYLENPSVWTDDFGIPESGNGTPDILDEVKWGLDWLERMQNDDGAMLSVMSLDSASPPSAAKGPSRYGPPNSSATLTSAGAFAMAAKVYSDVGGFNEASVRYAKRADKAWRWVEANPRVKFYNNDARSDSEGLAAGQQEVEADRMGKKMLISAIHMSALTGDSYYNEIVEKLYRQLNPMDPGVPNGFEGNMAYDMLYHARQLQTPKRFAARIKRDYTAKVLNGYNAWPAVVNVEDPYRAFSDGYWWGSNSNKMRRAQVFTQAIVADVGEAPKQAYLNAGAGYLHYIHGVNPLNKAYLSDMGGQGAENSVTEFYHNWFADGTDWDRVGTSKYGPAPGFLVGGPNDSYERDACCADVCGGFGAKMCEIPVKSPPTGQPPAKSYADFNEGWPINSWSVTENSNGYQINYLRVLSKYAR